MGGGLDVEQFEHVAGGDLPQPPALGRDDQRTAVEGAAGRLRRHAGLTVTHGPQPGEPVGVAGHGQVGDQMTKVERVAHQPAQAGADDVGADGRDQRPGQCGLPPGGGLPALAEPAGG
jgi:hypothetical protein